MADEKVATMEIINPMLSKEFLMTPLGMDIKKFELMQRKAQMYAASSIVPLIYQGKENIGNVTIALDMAERMGMNPLMVMQNLYIVHGNPGWSSKFLIATVNQCGRFSPLRYEWRGEGDKLSCRCYAYESSDAEKTERLEGTWVSIEMAKKEGWYDKNGSKWRSMPEQMLQYRAAAFWQRVYAPEISMGFTTEEEIRDAIDIPYEDVTSQKHIGFSSTAIQMEPQQTAAPVADRVAEPVEVSKPQQSEPPKAAPIPNDPRAFFAAGK